MKEQQKEWAKMKDSIKEKLDDRTRVLNPFRLDVERFIYRHALSSEQWVHLRALCNEPALFENLRFSSLATVVDLPADHDAHEFRVGFPKGGRDMREFPSLKTAHNMLLPQVQEYIRKWCARYLELADDKAKVVAKVHSVGRVCNTWGQVARMWPGLAVWFPNKMKQKYWRKRAASPLPEDAFMWDHVDGKMQKVGIHERYRPESFDFADQVLAEALLLPPYEHDQHGPLPSITWR